MVFLAIVFIAGLVTENKAHFFQDVIESDSGLVVPVKSFLQKIGHIRILPVSLAALVCCRSGFICWPPHRRVF